MIKVRRVFAIAVMTTAFTTATVAGQELYPGELGDVPVRKPEVKPASPPQPTEPKPPAPVVVRTSVDRTAVWVGDPIVYTIEITCPPGSDILAADISREQLKLTGLEVVDALQRRDASPEGKIVYRAQFRLVSYSTEGAAVSIDPLAVRYYVHTAGQPPETLTPADEVDLPARSITVRSTLSDGRLEWIRDAPRVAMLPAVLAYLTPAGMLALVMAFVPFAAALVALVRNPLPRFSFRARRKAAHLRRQVFEEIRGRDTVDPDVRRDTFDKVNALIRDRLTDFRIPAPSLTATEIESAMKGRLKHLRVSAIVAALRNCEMALYGGPRELPGEEAVSEAVQEAELLLAAKAR